MKKIIIVLMMTCVSIVTINSHDDAIEKMVTIRDIDNGINTLISLAIIPFVGFHLFKKLAPNLQNNAQKGQLLLELLFLGEPKSNCQKMVHFAESNDIDAIKALFLGAKYPMVQAYEELRHCKILFRFGVEQMNQSENCTEAMQNMMTRGEDIAEQYNEVIKFIYNHPSDWYWQELECETEELSRSRATKNNSAI